MTDRRPALNATTPADEFRAFYWLKAELLAFCRQYHISTIGSKVDLANRIDCFLRTGRVEHPPVPNRRLRQMSSELSRKTVIQPGFRCSQELRAFFVKEIGPHFHFNTIMRNFIRDGAGRTLLWGGVSRQTCPPV